MEITLTKAQLKNICFDIASDTNNIYWAKDAISKPGIGNPSTAALDLIRATERRYARCQMLGYLGLHCNITESNVVLISNETDETVFVYER